MSSTTSSSSGFFSSPRREQRLVWISGAILLVGLGVFLAVFLSRGGSQPATATVLTNASPPQTSTTSPSVPKTVTPSPAAFKVARTFLLTAVQRKNLDTAYGIVGPDLKGGLTLAQWRKGNIPVTPYPAANAKTAQFVVKSSIKNQLMLQVVLGGGRHGSHARPALAFLLGVDRLGGKWVVNYWLPDYSLPVKSNPYSN